MTRWPLLLFLPLTVFAQDDVWDDDAWEEDWDEEQQGIIWSGFVEAGLGTRFSEDELVDTRNTLEELGCRCPRLKRWLHSR